MQLMGSMTYEGSITPPLSDNENWDGDEDLHLDGKTSPVLKSKRPRLESHKLQHNELPSLPNIKKELSLDERFYEARMKVVQLEMQSANLCPLNDFAIEANADEIFCGIKSCIEKYLDSKQPDQMSHLVESLFAISNATCNVLDDGIDWFVQRYASKIYFSDGFSLHSCGNQAFVEWFHCYVIINNLLLDVAEELSKDCTTLPHHQVYHSNGMPVLEPGNLLTKVACRVVHEAALLAGNVFKNTVAGTFDWQHIVAIPASPCPCFDRLTSSCRSLLLTGDEFWSIITSIVNSAVQMSSQRDANNISYSTEIRFNDIQEALSFCWWWMQTLPLNGEVLCCHNLINRLVRLSISHCINDEHVFALHLVCYRRALIALQSTTGSREWKPSELASFNLLWRCVSQRLATVPATEKSEGIKQYSVRGASTQDWLEECKDVQSLISAKKPNDRMDSFKLFLAAMDVLLRNNEGSVWLQLKDRFFMRLQANVMKSTTELGIQRFFFISFVILKLCPLSTLEVTLNECLSVTEHCIIERSNLRKKEYFLAGLYGLMCICTERGASFKPAATKARKIFQSICSLLCDKNVKIDRWNEAYKLFRQYVNSFIYLLSLSRRFSADQAILFSSNCLRDSLNSLRPTEASDVLEFLQLLFSNLSSYIDSSCGKALVDFCWSVTNQMLTWLKKLVTGCSFEPHSKVSDVLYVLTKLWISLDNTHLSDRRMFSDLWRYFSCEVHIPAALTCDFMKRCLNESNVLSFLNDQPVTSDIKSKSISSLSDIAIQGWIKCSSVLPVENRPLSSLTSAIGRLEAVKTLSTGQLSEFTFHTFLKCLANKHQRSKNFLEKVSWVSKASLWFVPVVDVMLRATKDPQSVPLVYASLGMIFQSCGPLLHPGKPSFVSRVLEGLVVDTSNAKCSESVLAALHNHLHQIILGCLSIGMKNIFIAGVLKQIVKNYLTSWPCVESNGQLHPFLRVLMATSCGDDESALLELLHQILDTDVQTHRLATAVEIVYEWSRHKIKQGNPNNHSNFIAVLDKIRPQLRFNQTLLGKIDEMLRTFKTVTAT